MAIELPNEWNEHNQVESFVFEVHAIGTVKKEEINDAYDQEDMSNLCATAVNVDVSNLDFAETGNIKIIEPFTLSLFPEDLNIKPANTNQFGIQLFDLSPAIKHNLNHPNRHNRWENIRGHTTDAMQC